MKYDILNRLTGAIQISVDIDCAADASAPIKLGLAIRAAVSSRAYLADAYLADADLTSADLTSADLTSADLTGAVLTGAVLRGADLRGADLTRAYLRGADLRGADLTGADLTGADLADADLTRADLTGADLTGAYLRGAVFENLEIPAIHQIDAKILTTIEAGATLNMGAWHTCETTHCRAGWAIHLAGKEGYALEDKVGAQTAGMLIYRASRPDQPIPNFFASNEAAMADIRACAAEQLAATEK